MARRSTERRTGPASAQGAELHLSKRLRTGRSTSGAGVNPRLIAVVGGAALVTVLLVFLAPSLRAVPAAIQVVLVGLCAVFFPVQMRLARRPHRPLLGARPVFLVSCAAALVVQLSFIFAGVYFSDDSLRHSYDGLQLLRGSLIYVDSPATLGPIAGILPNHPELPSIYLPLTQLQAVLGAFIHARFGFPLVYHVVLLLALAFALRELPTRSRRLLVVLVLSPFFLIASSARHADVQGMVFVVLALALTGKRGARAHFFGGVLAAALPALKPLGLIWSVFLLADLAIRQRRLPRAFLAGAGLSALVLGTFGFVVLWRDQRSLFAFFETARFFADWFIAYNPVVLWRLSWVDLEQRIVILEYRREILTLLFGGLLFMPLLATARSIRGTLPTGFPRLLRRILRESMVWLLVLGVLATAVWHPWYFLWWLPALALTGRHRALALLPGLLILFYLPVAGLRLTGRWEYELLLFCVVGYLSAWFWLTRNRPSAGS